MDFSTPGWGEYQELRVLLRAAGGRVSVTLLPPEGDPVEGKFELPVNPREVAEAVATAVRSSEHQYIARNLSERDSFDPLKDLGSRLFTALFEGRRRLLYDQCLARTRSAGAGLRLRFVTLPGSGGDLDWVPWEFLYDSRRPDFVALSLGSVVRQRGEVTRPAPPPLALPVRVLVVAAEVDPGLGIAEEVGQLKTLLDGSPPFVAPTFLIDPTPEQFLRALEDSDCHVLDFIGRGVLPGDTTSPRTPGLLLMPGGAGRAGDVIPEQVVWLPALRDAVGRMKNLRLAAFESCYSELLAADLAGVVPAVVGMRGLVTARGCEVFSLGFYRALLHGWPLEAALTLARQQVDKQLTGSREWGLMQLYLQVPDGKAVLPRAQDQAGQQDYSVAATRSAFSELNSLALRLNILRQNLQALEQQRGPGGGALPDFLQAQFDETKGQIEKLESELSGH
jgi:hypothetical protein